MDIGSAGIKGTSHDKQLEFRGLGLQNLKKFEKWQVDILGNKTYVKSEKRMGFI